MHAGVHNHKQLNKVAPSGDSLCSSSCFPSLNSGLAPGKVTVVSPGDEPVGRVAVLIAELEANTTGEQFSYNT